MVRTKKSITYVVQFPKQFTSGKELAEYLFSERERFNTPRQIGDDYYISSGDQIYSFTEIGEAILTRGQWVSLDSLEELGESYHQYGKNKQTSSKTYLIYQEDVHSLTSDLDSWLMGGFWYQPLYHARNTE